MYLYTIREKLFDKIKSIMSLFELIWNRFSLSCRIVHLILISVNEYENFCIGENEKQKTMPLNNKVWQV